MYRNKQAHLQHDSTACLVPKQPELTIRDEFRELVDGLRNRPNDRVLRLPQVKAKTGRSCAAIWKDVAAGVMPPPFPIGARAVGWLESEINIWIEARIVCARTPHAVDMCALIDYLTATTRSNGRMISPKAPNPVE